MSPMQRWQGTVESFATAYHVHHYGRCAASDIGLVIVESTAVAACGRLFHDDIGIFTDAHIEPLRRVVQAIKDGGARAAVQLSHGGRKSFPPAGERLVAPSAIAFDNVYGMPAAMTQADIALTVQQFADATRRSLEAGFEAIEIHAAHGYLVNQFLSPLANQRTDEYGGSLENRARILYQIYDAIRAVTGPDYPIFVRVSATDFTDGGLTVDDISDILAPLVPKGLAAVDVSAGGVLPIVPPGIGPEYQVPYATVLKEKLGIPVMAVGIIRGGSAAERILADGRADMVAIGRPLLENPHYVTSMRAAAEKLFAELETADASA